MGPGRWGSRGDITLGVRVTYAGISNTAMLIEIARRKGSYVPDLSFGTHFFQDLVEARIRYLALYPDEDGILFNEDFFRGRRTAWRSSRRSTHTSRTSSASSMSRRRQAGWSCASSWTASEDEALGFLAETTGTS